jgi:hypothetical protein
MPVQVEQPKSVHQMFLEDQADLSTIANGGASVNKSAFVGTNPQLNLARRTCFRWCFTNLPMEVAAHLARLSLD